MILFPPFSSQRPLKVVDKLKDGQARLRKSKLSPNFFKESPLKENYVYPFSLQVCSRADFMPKFFIRAATIEDSDDVVPLLRKNNVWKDY